MNQNYDKAMYWYASDDYNVPYTGGFVVSGLTTALVPFQLKSTGSFPSTINFEPGDIVASDNDWAVAQIIKRQDDDTLLLDKDIFTTIGTAFRVYRNNNSVGGIVYNVAGTAKDFTVQPIDVVPKYSERPMFTVQSNATLPVKVIKVLDLGTTMKKFLILY
jgi:hypothetical protein